MEAARALALSLAGTPARSGDAGKLHDALLDLADDPYMASWLAEVLACDWARGQHLWRTAWNVYATTRLEDGTQTLLFGVPCELSSMAWDTRSTAQELQGWVQAEFALDLVAVNPAPVALRELRTTAPRKSGDYSLQLLSTGVGDWPLTTLEEPGPAVWPVVAVLDTDAQLEALAQRLRAPLRPSLSYSALKNRVEALAEEQGVLIGLGPATTWENAHSLAAILSARGRFLRCANVGQHWVLQWHWPLATLVGPSQNLLLEIAVETPEDIRSALNAAAVRRGLPLVG